MKTAKRVREGEKTRRQIAERWGGKDCTLDGRPARIVGRFADFPQVRPDDPQFASVEFSWEAVELVMSAGGKFKAFTN